MKWTFPIEYSIRFKHPEINSPSYIKLTSQTLYIQFYDVGTHELLPISQKPLKISNWNFTCILQGYIGIRKYQYLNFEQVPHLDPKSHGWSHLSLRSLFCLFMSGLFTQVLQYIVSHRIANKFDNKKGVTQ